MSVMLGRTLRALAQFQEWLGLCVRQDLQFHLEGVFDTSEPVYISSLHVQYERSNLTDAYEVMRIYHVSN